jgi:hypothetical protein
MFLKSKWFWTKIDCLSKYPLLEFMFIGTLFCYFISHDPIGQMELSDKKTKAQKVRQHHNGRT